MEGEVHIYLDERDNRSEEMQDLKPNGLTDSKEVTDFPLRNRLVKLHVRRRRWIDNEGHNTFTGAFPLTAEGTKLSDGFGRHLKKNLGFVPSDSELSWSLLWDERKSD